MAKKIARILFFAAMFVFIGAGTYHFYMDSRFVDYPRTQNRESAHVVPYTWKSTTIYLTNAEAETLDMLHTIEIISFLLAGASFIVVRWGGNQSKKRGQT